MLLTNFQLITSDWYCQPIHPTCSRVSLTILVEKVLFRLNISNLSSFSSNLCSSHCHQEKVEEKVQTGFLSSWKNIKHCLFVHWTSFFLGLPFTSHVVIGKVVLVSPFVCPLLVASDFFFFLDLSHYDPVFLCSSFYFQLEDCKVAEVPVILPNWFLVTLHIFAFYCCSLHFCLNKV